MTAVQPIILLRVKIAAIGKVLDIVLVTSVAFLSSSGSWYGTTIEQMYFSIYHHNLQGRTHTQVFPAHILLARHLRH